MLNSIIVIPEAECEVLKVNNSGPEVAAILETGKLFQSKPNWTPFTFHYLIAKDQEFAGLLEYEIVDDYVVITKGDIVSQAEREVFSSRVASVNPSAIVMNINGLTGQGTYELSTLLYDENNSINTVNGMELKFAMPTALCSYCLGEKKIGAKYQMGNIKKMKLEDKNA